jgi:GT2 family glycosyltransferase
MLRLKVLLFDNSPDAQGVTGLFEQEQYLSAPGNPGLAEAYNTGIRMAQQQGFDWLLTLDQDTVLPETFLAELVRAIVVVSPTPEIAAVVPLVQGAGRVLSPYVFRWGALPQWFRPGYVGVPDSPTYALNSASLLRVDALRQVGGYDPRFWLDASDHAIFHRMHEHGKRVYVAGNIQVTHDLSVLSNNQMSVTRYRNLLAAESAFWDLSMNKLAGWERTTRLLVRMLRQVRDGQSELRKATGHYLWLRLLHTRKYRLQLWQREIAARSK